VPQPKLATRVRRDQIVEAALGLIAQHGLRRLSMAALARRVGLVPSAIYRHFRGKDEVLDAMIAFIHARLIANVQAARGRTPRTLERLERLLMDHVQLIRENKAIPLIVFSEDVYYGRPTRRAAVHDMLRDYLGHVGGLIREGQAEGVIRPDLDPGTGSVMFLGLVQPAAILWHVSDSAFDVTRQAAAAWRLFRETITGASPLTAEPAARRSPPAQGEPS